jgi:hypothetical protein
MEFTRDFEVTAAKNGALTSDPPRRIQPLAAKRTEVRAPFSSCLRMGNGWQCLGFVHAPQDAETTGI